MDLAGINFSDFITILKGLIHVILSRTIRLRRQKDPDCWYACVAHRMLLTSVRQVTTFLLACTKFSAFCFIR